MSPTALAPSPGAPPVHDDGPAVVPTSLDPVALVAWPDDAARRGTLAAQGRPRLLVIDDGAPPPVCWDDLEDWVRRSADPDEVGARAENLVRRIAPGPSAPVLDTDGILRSAAGWVAIPPIEARILTLLLHRPGVVVARDDLVEAGWPHGTSDDRILDSRIKLLRRRIAPLGLELHTVRNVGLLLHVA